MFPRLQSTTIILLAMFSIFKSSKAQPLPSLPDIIQEAADNAVTISARFKCARDQLFDIFQHHPEDFLNLHPWMSPVEIKHVEPAANQTITTEYFQTEKVPTIPGLPPSIINPTFTVNVTNTVEPTEDGVIITMKADSKFGLVVLKSVYRLEEEAVETETAEAQAYGTQPKETLAKLVEVVSCVQSPNFIAAKMGLRQASKARKVMLERLNEKLGGTSGGAVVEAQK